jgi:hypothetical protein
MAITEGMRERIAAMARELAAEWGEVDDREALSWLDAIESQAVEITDALQAELVPQKAIRLADAEEARCPQCRQGGRCRGERQRELMGRRGPITIREPEYFCPGCRRAFFPADPCDRG